MTEEPPRGFGAPAGAAPLPVSPEGPAGEARPLGLDAAGVKVLVVLELLFSLAHSALGACLLVIVGQIGDTRLGWAVLAGLFALCLAAAERLATGHRRASLLLASLPTAAWLLLDAYLVATGPGRG